LRRGFEEPIDLGPERIAELGAIGRVLKGMVFRAVHGEFFVILGLGGHAHVGEAVGGFDNEREVMVGGDGGEFFVGDEFSISAGGAGGIREQGDAVGDKFAEFVADVFERDGGVFDDVMEVGDGLRGFAVGLTEVGDGVEVVAVGMRAVALIGMGVDGEGAGAICGGWHGESLTVNAKCGM
jgi:hypothetical protein